ncbi:MAG: Hpt domain-containing protein [Pseudomonadota bacterium]
MNPPIDTSHLEKYVFGDAALRDEILSIFIEQAAAWIARMDPSLDDDGWRHAAHTLKGAARGVGAWSLGDIAERAETLVGSGRNGERRAAHEDLKAAANAAIGFARKIRDRAA